MPKVVLIGCGSGLINDISERARAAIDAASAIVGSERLIEAFGREGVRCVVAVRAVDVMAAIDAAIVEAGDEALVCALFSGDTGFYSGARQLLALLEERGIEAQVICGTSSVQKLAAALHESWQDWELVSAHGLAANAARKLMGGRDVFFLTGSTLTPAALAAQLVEAGLGEAQVVVGERLGYAEERIVAASAREVAQMSFDSLAVMLARAVKGTPHRAPGIADELFIRGKVPMTKQLVRAAILAKLGVTADDVCWDVGAGTGSVSVELALQAAEVWAVERNPEGVALIEENRRAFGAYNLHVVEGVAPAALTALPAPDVVFIGGSGASMAAIVEAALAVNPAVRICASAIALETIHAAMEALAMHGIEPEVTQLSVASTKKAGELHLLMGQNPTFLICGSKGCE